MNSKLAGFIVFIVVCLVLLMGAGIFWKMHRTVKESDIELIASQKEIKLSELQQHNIETDCWTYIGGQVFNATEIIVQNPELKATLLTACGTDGSRIYTLKKYTDQPLDEKTIARLRDVLGNYQVGLLSP